MSLCSNLSEFIILSRLFSWRSIPLLLEVTGSIMIRWCFFLAFLRLISSVSIYPYFWKVQVALIFAFLIIWCLALLILSLESFSDQHLLLLLIAHIDIKNVFELIFNFLVVFSLFFDCILQTWMFWWSVRFILFIWPTFIYFFKTALKLSLCLPVIWILLVLPVRCFSTFTFGSLDSFYFYVFWCWGNYTFSCLGDFWDFLTYFLT